MAIEEIRFSTQEIQDITTNIIEIFSQGGSQLRAADIDNVISQLNSYLNQLQILQNDLQNFIITSNAVASVQNQADRMQSYKKGSNDYQNAKKQYNMARQSMITELRNQEYLQRASVLFKEGYRIIMGVRQIITKEDIKYEIAIEGGKNSTSRIYSVDESQLLQDIYLDTYSLAKSLLSGQSQITFNMRYSATKTKSEATGSTIIEKSLSKKDGSTIWSKGYKVFEEVKQWVATNPEEAQGYGVNFGHFVEAYYAYGGNSINRKPSALSSFNSVRFLQLMLSLQNSDEFYSGGDIGDIQLKSNNATLTSIKTIELGIIKMRNILISKRTKYKKELKALFTTQNKGNLDQIIVDSTSREINAHLRELVEALDISSTT